MQSLHFDLNKENNVTLKCYLNDLSEEYGKEFKECPAIIVLPGGGYSMCSDREADCVALAYLAAGYQAFVLRYTLRDKKGWDAPLKDYETAVDIIREHAEEWHLSVDRIAVIGFSAGGHLAACAATMAKRRPAAAILGYASLKQDIADACQPGMPAPIEHIDDSTPPCFLFATRNDNIVPIANTIDFISELDKKGINFECHIYSFGQHGFSTGDKFLNETNDMCLHIGEWVHDSLDFLEDVMGKMTTTGFTAPRIGRCVNGNFEDSLSIECTYGYLKGQKAAASVIGPIVSFIDNYLEKTHSITLREIVLTFKLTDLLDFFHMGDKKQSLDEALKKIKNVK